jgi:hypothetical protein
MKIKAALLQWLGGLSIQDLNALAPDFSNQVYGVWDSSVNAKTKAQAEIDGANDIIKNAQAKIDKAQKKITAYDNFSKLAKK